MKLLKKLDLSSRLLILLGLIGISVSSLALLRSFTSEEEGFTSSQPVANISFVKSDTRVKRSGNVHWYSVTGPLPCYGNDLIFTGDHSTATVEFGKGDRIYLLPNSLVSVSDNFISLESGSIEVDLTGAGAITIESFGKSATFKDKGRFRIIQTDSEHKLIPISGEAPSIALFGIGQNDNDSIADSQKKKELIQTFPLPGTTIAIFENHPLFLKWTYSGSEQTFTVKIEDKSFSVKEPQLRIKKGELSPGKKKWQVVNAEGVSSESEFELINEIKILLESPAHNEKISLDKGNISSVVFTWHLPVSLTQKIHIAADRDFHHLLKTEVVSQSTYNTILGPGTYHWKVGLYEGENLLFYSDSRAFTLLAESPVLHKLEVKPIPKVLDFSLTPLITLKVRSNGPLKNLTSHLTGDGVNRKSEIKNSLLQLSKLPDGEFKLQVTGQAEDLKEISSPVYILKVKSSTPTHPPKIEKKKVKLFVHLIRKLMDFIFPSAMAKGKPTYPLKWDGLPSHKYEIEITDSSKTTTLEKKIIETNSHGFVIPGPGTYYWRIRQKEEEGWGPFTEFNEIIVEDKIELLSDPLMTNATLNGKQVNFEWKEPFKDFTYTLEIYSENDPTPFKSLIVKGGKHTEIIDGIHENRKISWRVWALSTHGNKSKDLSKFEVLIPKIINHKAANISSKDKKLLYIARGSYHFTSSAYEQKAENPELSQANQKLKLHGQNLLIKAEARGQRWDGTLSGRYQSLSSGQISLTNTEYHGEFGRILRQDPFNLHILLAGLLYGKTSMGIENSDGDYTYTLFTLRYQLEKRLTNKYTLEFGPMILLPMESDIKSPSVRVTIGPSYYFKNNLWLNLSMAYEVNRSSLDYDYLGFSGKLNIRSDVLLYGATINWSSF